MNINSYEGYSAEMRENMGIVPICGLILWIVFYGSYLAKIYVEKKKGVSVSRMGLGEKALGTRIVEVFLLILTYGTAAVQLLSILFYDKWERLVTVWLSAFNCDGGALQGMMAQDGGKAVAVSVDLVGTLIATVGTVFFLLAMKEMKGNWRAGIDESQHTSMVTGGIYRVSRNPAFVGFDLFYIGFGILFSNGLMLLFAVLGIFTFHMQIKEEEKYMERKYGEAYKAYRETVRRYL